MKEIKNPVSKRNQMVINLIQTPGGYSIIQGTCLLNKPQAVPQPSVNTQSNSAVNTVPQQTPIPVIKQPPKMNIKQNSLLFLKSPNQNAPTSIKQVHQKKWEKEKTHLANFASWFDYNNVAQIQKSEVANWITELYSGNKSIDGNFLNSQIIKYKKHRNITIDVYYANYARSKSYMSASTVRKYIYEDARWLMKIHVFLTSWGIINAAKINYQNQKFAPSAFFKINMNNEYDNVKLTNSFYNNHHMILQEYDTYNVLKKITSQIRPYCDFCGIHCEMVWFQHIRIMDPKEISTIMKNVNSKNPPLSEKQYEIILCTKCYCNGNFPLLLTHHDFRKVSVNDRLQPGGKKKKQKKSKRKDKKRKFKQAQRQKQMQEQYQEEKEEIEQVQQQASKRQKQVHVVQVKQKQQAQNQQQYQKQGNGNASVIGNGKQRKQVHINNGVKQKTDNRNIQVQKEVNVNQVIQEIVTSVRKQKQWSLQQTKKMLQLVNKYGDDWDSIYKNMLKVGYCQNCDIQQLITYFIKLPQMNVSTLFEQTSNQSFIERNKQQNKSQFLMRKIQSNFNNSVKLSHALKMKQKRQMNQSRNWKDLLDRFVQIHIKKINQKISSLSNLQARALIQQRKFEEATKQISQQ